MWNGDPGPTTACGLWGWEVLQKAGQTGWDCIWHGALSPSVTLAPFSKASWNHSLEKTLKSCLLGNWAWLARASLASRGVVGRQNQLVGRRRL